MRRETPGLRRSQPPAGVIDVWQVDQRALAAQGKCTLSIQERDRAGRLVRPELAEAFRNRRRALRAILAGYLDCAPEELELSAGAGGKTVLRHTDEASDLRFSVSGSSDVGLIAVAAGSDIGVDVEALRPVDRVEALVRRYLAPAEVNALLAVDPLQRSAAFLRCWTRKEAVMKAHGAGMALGLRCIEVGLSAPRVEIEGRGFSVLDLAAKPGYSAAVAAEGPIRQIRYCAMPG